MLTGIEVGKPYPGVHRIPESAIFDFNQAGGLLLIALDNPTKKEIQDIRKGDVKLGLLDKGGVIFLLSKFGSMNWMDSPYHVSMSGKYTLAPVFDVTQGYLLQIVLLNSNDRIVKVIRVVGMPHEMSLMFRDLVEKQRGTSINEYYPRLHEIYTRYSTEDLVKVGRIWDL